ncbi:hypothetical protein BB560_002312 [Smittium megazygosporum]|uniref:Uncharacterized protein n=1 Tax=Smittium megazygosporum TaxID=133381 RepID=A0A2T9XYX0_9FUNG|nr:hypothetical protein BB560_007080 [Smittium megazygosporum]PVV03226.1 hypothetical protein BB560_002312 [Smittium megazygosporum]
MDSKSSLDLLRKSSFDSNISGNSASTKIPQLTPYSKEILDESSNKVAPYKRENFISLSNIGLVIAAFVKDTISTLKNNCNPGFISSKRTISDSSTIYKDILSSKKTYRRTIPCHRSTTPMDFGGFVPPLAPKRSSNNYK